MSARLHSCLEPLEARIAPATIVHPLPDITVGAGQTETVVDLSKLFDATETGNYANRTLVTIRTNFDADPDTDGIQGDITIELFDDLAPLTVQNFLRYALNTNAKGDYDGTFFHRLQQGFVLQGGGFQTNGKKISHIDSFPEVHNEYDPSRSNVRGTLALAKTELSPNTGTSEWFINLGDNSGNLDNQNGGFTVFGRVIDVPGVVDGMDVIDRMAELPQVQGVVGNFPTPVQNYNPDPDNNPNTPSPKVKPQNLITIEDVIVQRSQGGNDAGVTYKSVKVTDLEGNPSNLVTPTLNGSDLALKYAKGQAGVAKVTVEVEKGNEVVEESFLVTLKPNLTTHLHTYDLPTAIIPGDISKVKLDIVNNGGAVADGIVEVKFYLQKWTLNSQTQQYQPTNERIEANSFEKVINLASGETLVFNAELQVPQALAQAGTVYKVLVEVVPKEGSFNSDELYPHDSLYADNTALEGRLHQIHNQFGTFNTSLAGGRSKTVLTYVEPDGDIVEFSIKGAGTGKLTEVADGIVDLQLNGTNAKTKVFAKVVGGNGNGDGNISIRNIDAITPVGTAKWSQIDLNGNIAFTNGIKKLELGDITGPSTISIAPLFGAPSARANLTFGSITDLTLESTMRIGTFRAAEWIDTIAGGADKLEVPALQTLAIGTKSVRGDLQADIEVTSSAAVKSFMVSGTMETSTVRIYGNVNKVQLGAMKDSSFLVGANERPESLAGFTDDRTIRKFTITGLDQEAPEEGYDFVNSTIAAVRLLNLKLGGTIDFSSGSGEFGVVADVIKRYQREGQPAMKSLKAPAEYDTANDWNYLVRVV